MHILDFFRYSNHLYLNAKHNYSGPELDAGIEKIEKGARHFFEPMVEALAIGALTETGRSYRMSIDRGLNRFEEDDFVRITIGHFNDREASGRHFFDAFFADFPLSSEGLKEGDTRKRSFTIKIPVTSVLRGAPLYFVDDGKTEHVHASPRKVSAALYEKFSALRKEDLTPVPVPPLDGKPQPKKSSDLSPR